MTRIVEDPDSLNYETNYTYDVLSNLRKVAQGSQERFFMYDSLSRLIRAKNPEQSANSNLNLTDPVSGNTSWSLGYGYDGNSNLTTRTDARNIVTTLQYDEINRNRETTYSDGTPKIKRYYDEATVSNGKGRLWKSEVLPDGTNPALRSAINEFDEMGRVKSYTQGYYEGSAWENYTSLSEYDLAGNRISETYPSGRVVATSYSGAGRMSTLATNDIQLLSEMSYTPFGAIASERYGSGLTRTLEYNSRAQVTEIRLGHLDVTDSVLRLNYLYGRATAVNDEDGELEEAENNGNIARIKYTIGGSLKYSQTFQFDQLNRLKFAVEHDDGVLTDAKRAWWQTFDYDRWGNRGLNTTGSATSSNMTQSGSALGIGDFSSSTNRISHSSFGYDLAGNLTVLPGRPDDIFDGENKLIESTVNSIVSSYVYDADGRRVKKTVGSAVTKFVYNAEGELIAEYQTSGTTPAYTILFATADHLGSPRVWTNGGGAVAGGRHDYAPFGEELGTGHGGVRSTIAGFSATSQADGQKKQFTSKERDSETGLDLFGARYFASAQGRFTSADPLYIEVGRLSDPQQLNTYTYARNSPLKFVDPTGLDITVTGTEKENYLTRLRQDVSFHIKLNSTTSKVEIVDKSGKELDKRGLKQLGKGLRGGEKELFSAITDTKNHVTIHTVRKDADVFFGRFEGGGRNTIDFGDVDLLDNSRNAGGFSASQVVGHETLEAYAASRGKRLGDAHDFANQFFGGLGVPLPASAAIFDANYAHLKGVTAEFPIHGKNGVNAKITLQFVTPIPVGALASTPAGSQRAHVTNVEKSP